MNTITSLSIQLYSGSTETSVFRLFPRRYQGTRALGYEEVVRTSPQTLLLTPRQLLSTGPSARTPTPITPLSTIQMISMSGDQAHKLHRGEPIRIHLIPQPRRPLATTSRPRFAPQTRRTPSANSPHNHSFAQQELAMVAVWACTRTPTLHCENPHPQISCVMIGVGRAWVARVNAGSGHP